VVVRAAIGSAAAKELRRAGGQTEVLGPNTGDIAYAESSNLRSQAGLVAVTGIHQHHTSGQTGGLRRFDLLESDLGLGLESGRLRHLGVAPTPLILGPILSEIDFERKFG
jgi:hypothetical protein